MGKAKNTMRAGVFRGPRCLEQAELDRPQPAAGEVLLRVEACGVCGTDHHIWAGELTDGVQPPVVLGHEIAARVEALGPGVAGLEPGQPCSVDPVFGCGACRMCRSARENLCERPAIIGYNRNGGFAQYVRVPAGKVVPLAASAGPAGGVLCETLACVVHGYDRLAPPAGAAVLVLGAGTVGLLWTVLLRSTPCERIVQTEPAAFRRAKAAELGADAVIDPTAADADERLRDALGGGADCIIDATGEPTAVQQALPLLARGGTFLIFGVCPAGSALSFDPFELYNKEARIVASKMPPHTLDRSAALIASGRVPCEQLVTATFGLAHLEAKVAGFHDHRDSQVKVAIDPWA